MNDKAPIAIIATFLALLIWGGVWWMTRSREVPANATPAAVTATEAPIDTPSTPAPVDLPPLDQMDAFLRPLIAALSSRPELARWLATDDLLRQLAMAINQASTGASPSRDFKVVAPTSPFRAAGRGTTRTIDPASYRRYDGLVETLTSIDATAAARLYQTIRPRLNEAYQSLGNAGRSVDPAVQSTIDILLETPVVRDPIQLTEAGAAGWAYADVNLEALLPTQRQLLRMGPNNVERVQVWLRAFQAALQ